MDLPDTRQMNNRTARATSRDILSPRYGTSHSLARNENLPIAAMIPTLELRRLVATMVD